MTDDASFSITVRLFAIARQWAGCDTVEVRVPAAATVGDLRATLVARIPPLENSIDRMLIAIDQEYVADETPLRPDADAALIPPVSGG